MSERGNVRDRRSFLTSMGAAAVAAPLLGASVARAGETGEAGEAPINEDRPRALDLNMLGEGAAAAPAALLAPLVPGVELAFGWIFEGAWGPDRGAVLVRLQREGIEARVHICRNDGCPAGLASTEQLDLLLMNQTEGEASEEELARAVVFLASVLGGNGPDAVPAGLLSHEERIARYLGQDKGALL